MRLVSNLALTAFTGTLALALTGCGAFSFVSDRERQDLKDSLDDDNDGVPAVDDCDDENPLRRPTGDPEDPSEPWADLSWVEIPYDGIDNDCDDIDDVDVDGDGFPGISFDDYAAMQMERLGLSSPDDVPWPTDVDRLQTDCVDGSSDQVLPDNVSAADVNPAVLDDEPYDGVDRDCAGDNDFDDDGDGQMPATVNGEDVGPLLDAYIANWGLEGTIDPTAPNAFGDCDDQNEDVFTGAPGEMPYDAIDQDCSGDNDFDQDGDGYYPTEYAANFAAFVQNFHPEDAPDGPAAWGPDGASPAAQGDCLDQPHPNIPTADPALVYPGATDIWYDGIDADCLGDNDYDQDGDLYIQQADAINLVDYVANWSGSQQGYPSTVDPLFEAEAGDCDDTNPAVAPGNLEYLGDAIDADCDLNVDATPWGFNGYAWDTPTWPRIVRTNEHYVLGTTGLWTSLSNRQNPALALLFEPTNATYNAEEDLIVVWNNISPAVTFVHGSGFDMLAQGDAFWIAATYRQPGQGGNDQDNARLLVRQHNYDPVLGYQYELANRVLEWHGFDVDLDLQIDDQDYLWVMACGGGGRDEPNAPVDTSSTLPTSFRTFSIGAPVFTDVGQQDVQVLQAQSTGNGSSVCFQELATGGVTALQTVCDSAGCESYDIDGTMAPGTVTPSADTTWQNSTFHEADEHEGLLLLADVGGGATIVDNVNAATYTAFPGEEVLSVDGMWRNGVLYVAAVVEVDSEPNTVRLAYGSDPANGFDTVVELPVYDYDTSYEHTEATPGCDPLQPLCTTGRNLEPYKITLFADQDRLALGVAARSLDILVAPTDTLSNPLPQDAVGWIFMGYDDVALP